MLKEGVGWRDVRRGSIWPTDFTPLYQFALARRVNKWHTPPRWSCPRDGWSQQSGTKYRRASTVLLLGHRRPSSSPPQWEDLCPEGPTNPTVGGREGGRGARGPTPGGQAGWSKASICINGTVLFVSRVVNGQ